MVATASYLTIAGGTAADPKFRVVKVTGEPVYGAPAATDTLTQGITLYEGAVAVAEDVSRILGVLLILPV